MLPSIHPEGWDVHITLVGLVSLRDELHLSGFEGEREFVVLQAEHGVIAEGVDCAVRGGGF